MSNPNDPLDYSDQYNTQLTPQQEAQYQQWLQLQSALNHRDMSRDNYDYDMRGAFASGATQAANAHWPDTFKKPNHPSFSDQSQYNGVNGASGGTWSQDPNGVDPFTPGPTNIQMHGVQGLQSYFQTRDPTVQLMIPTQASTMQDYVRQTLAAPPAAPSPLPVAPAPAAPSPLPVAPAPTLQDYVRRTLAPPPVAPAPVVLPPTQ